MIETFVASCDTLAPAFRKIGWFLTEAEAHAAVAARPEFERVHDWRVEAEQLDVPFTLGDEVEVTYRAWRDDPCDGTGMVESGPWETRTGHIVWRDNAPWIKLDDGRTVLAFGTRRDEDGRLRRTHNGVPFAA